MTSLRAGDPDTFRRGPVPPAAARLSRLTEKEVWALGDYHPLLTRLGLAEIGLRLTARVGVAPGMRVLDVATGTGNVALPAAAMGAEVCGVDITAEMLARTALRAGEAGLRVALSQADAEFLPFADDTFDRVLSSLGVMFASGDRRAVRELVRVCRPGGVIGVCSWTPGSVPGVVGRMVGSYLGNGDAGDDAGPLQWGCEELVRRLFARQPVEIDCGRQAVAAVLSSAGDYLRLLADHSGPFVVQRHVLEARRAWAGVCTRVGAVLEDRNETPGDGWTAQQEYLVVVARKHDGPSSGDG
jgi:SAM-dependent methyltransferase